MKTEKWGCEVNDKRGIIFFSAVSEQDIKMPGPSIQREGEGGRS